MSSYSVPRRNPQGSKVRPTRPDKTLGKEIHVKQTVVLPHGVRLTIALGDITGEKVDAVVNAANSKLMHGSGLAKAIAVKGGPAIKKESEQWIQSRGLVPTGQLAVTSGGNLHARYVLHVVGPIYDDGRQGEGAALQQSIVSALTAADELRCTAIAVPAISSGLFRFPKDQCAQILIDEAIAFDKRTNGSSSVTEIRFTNFDSDTVGYFERYFATIVPTLASQPPASASTAAPPAAAPPAAATEAPAGGGAS